MSQKREFLPYEAAMDYLPLMHEFAIRTDLVAQACDGHLGLTPPYAREFSYLQFRRMCELIALGCLYLHSDLPIAQGSALKKEWHASDIMNRLKKDYAFAFPQAAHRVQTKNGWDLTCNSKPDALTYVQFRQLYAECGEVLHRGNIRTVLHRRSALRSTMRRFCNGS